MASRLGALLFALALVACRADASTSAPAATSSDEPSDQPLGPRVSSLTSTEDWNASQIDWQPTYDAALAKAKATSKPILLVFSTTWCPHCKNYRHVFDDPRVVAKAKQFVMVKLDADQQFDLSKQFGKDGTYIPRTYFLSSDGKPDYDVHAQRPKFLYFYDESDPQALLGGMDEALKKLKG